MKIKEVVEIQQQIITDIICDSCGKSCTYHIDDNKYHSIHNYFELISRFGYGSKKDGEEWTAQICEKCVDEKLSFINFNKKQ